MDRKDTPKFPSAKIPRRQAGIILLGAAAALTLSSEAHAAAAAPDTLSQPPAYIPSLSPRDRFKNTIEQFANRQLDPAQAHDILSQQAEWNASLPQSIVNPEVFARTYILTNGPETTVRPRFNPNSDPMTDPVVLSFYERYPNYPYNPENAKRILTVYNSGVLGATPIEASQESFIVLDALNNPNVYTPQQQKDHSYEGPFTQAIAKDPVPVKVLVSAGQHEGVHQTYWGIKSYLDPEIVEYLRNFGGRRNGNIFTGTQDNFSLAYISQTPGGAAVASYEVKLNEFATDFTSASSLSESGLPYVPGYDFTPLDFANFAKVITQSGISFRNFISLYEGGYLKEFYQSVALGAEKDGRKVFTQSDKPENLTHFGIELFPWWDYPVWNADPRTKRRSVREFFSGLAA